MSGRRGPRMIMLLALVTGLLLAAACGDDDPAIRLGEDNIDISDEELPDDWPNDFPVYPDALLQSSLAGRGGIEGVVATWVTADSTADVGDWYDDQFATGPWSETADGDLPPDSRFFSATNEDETLLANVSIGRDDEDNTAPTNITVAITEAPGTTGNGPDPVRDLPDEVALPDDYPSDVAPLPGDSRLVSASVSAGAGGETFLVEMMSQRSPDELRGHFEQELPDRGWDETLATDSADEIYLAYARGDDQNESPDSVNVTILESGVAGYTSVVVAVTVFER